MKHSLKAFIFVLVASISVQAADYFKPELYEIKSKSQGAVVGYLFGTFHIADTEDLPATFWGYFKKADGYLFESGLRTNTDKLDHFLSVHSYRDPKLKSLDELLSKKETQNLNLYLRGYSKAEKQKFLYTHSAFGVLNFIDGELVRLVAPLIKGKKITVTYDMQLAKAVENSKSIEALDLETEDFFNCAYQTNEQESLKKLKRLLKIDYVASIKAGKAFYNWPMVLDEKCDVTGRNELWLPEILSHLKSQKLTFIAIGVAHVSGEDPNLIALLKKNGYDVNLVKL